MSIEKRITFAEWREITENRDDFHTFVFPFSLVALTTIGEPDEAQHTTCHKLIVTIEKNRLPAWNLSNSNVVKVVFELGRRKLVAAIKSKGLQADYEVAINTINTSADCPFDPRRICEPIGAQFSFPIERKIGF